jgi:hypothetical protein
VCCGWAAASNGCLHIGGCHDADDGPLAAAASGVHTPPPLAPGVANSESAAFLSAAWNFLPDPCCPDASSVVGPVPDAAPVTEERASCSFECGGEVGLPQNKEISNTEKGMEGRRGDGAVGRDGSRAGAAAPAVFRSEQHSPPSPRGLLQPRLLFSVCGAVFLLRSCA